MNSLPNDSFHQPQTSYTDGFITNKVYQNIQDDDGEKRRTEDAILWHSDPGFDDDIKKPVTDDTARFPQRLTGLIYRCWFTG